MERSSSSMGFRVRRGRRSSRGVERKQQQALREKRKSSKERRGFSRGSSKDVGEREIAAGEGRGKGGVVAEFGEEEAAG